MTGFQGYDQWKTASPYDDYDDEHCAYCGADLPDDVTGLSDDIENAIMDGYCNPECQAEGDKGNISPRYGLPPAPNAEQWEQIRALYAHLATWRQTSQPAPATFEEISEHFPDGDFRWEDDFSPGDAHVYRCGEKDCPEQWHETYLNTTFERKDGVITIDVYSGDRDGNWDIDTTWTEGDDWHNSGVGYHFGEYALREHFADWLEYWLDAAETGKDPCTVISQVDNNSWVDFCIKQAQRNAKALPLKAEVSVTEQESSKDKEIERLQAQVAMCQEANGRQYGIIQKLQARVEEQDGD